jgi:hypothetical protein
VRLIADVAPLPAAGYMLRPAVAGITGGLRSWTVLTISEESIPCK